MNIQRILLSAVLGATLVVTAACGTDAAEQGKSNVTKDVKVEARIRIKVISKYAYLVAKLLLQ